MHRLLAHWHKVGALRRFCLFFLLVAALAFFLHIREERCDILELNTESTRYVMAQTAFSFLDEETTQIFRQQASRDIGEIYRFDEKFLEDKVRALERYLIEDETWRDTFSEASFDQMIRGAHALNKTLLKMRFTDPRTLQKMKQLKMAVRNIETMPSKEMLDQLHTIDHFWELMREKSFASDLPAQVGDFIVTSFRKDPYALHEDLFIERMLREKVQERIPLKESFVEAGSPIVEPGEKITHRHLAMLRAMKEALARENNLKEPSKIIGSILLSLLFLCLAVGYLRIRLPRFLESFSKLTLTATIVILTLSFAKILEYLLFHQANLLLPFVRYPICLSFAGLLLSILIGTEIALFTTVFLSIVMTLSLASAFEFGHFLVINVITGVAAVLLARRLRKRSQIFSVSLQLFVIALIVIVAFHLVEKTLFTRGVLSDIATSFVSLFFSAILIIGLLPLLESWFSLLTDITLMQLLDSSHPLLKRLSLEAPGTYQHSLVAGHLAESAAHAIGANGLFCRTAMLYHDVGKLFNPHYFTENQFGGFNIHALLTPRESTQVIMSHIVEGELLARKHHLPSSFIDIIHEHHGTSRIYYFYRKQLELVQGDPTQIDERQFRYKGPKPRSRESAIIMVADSLEAAARGLEEVSESAVSALVDRIVLDRVIDGQLDECKLTFEELSIIKKTMVKMLLIGHHMRIRYPTKEASKEMEPMEISF